MARWPGWVYSGGKEPDPRFSLANERTFLAWIRTTLALMAAAAAVEVLDLPMAAGLQTFIAVVLTVTALLCAVQAGVGWARSERALRREEPLPGGPINATLLLGVTVVAVALLVGTVAG